MSLFYCSDKIMPCSPHYTTSATTYPSIHYSVLQSIKHAPKCTFKSDTKQCILVHFECISVHWWGVGLEVVWSKSHDRLKTIRKIVVVNQIWPQLSNKVILNWHNVVHFSAFWLQYSASYYTGGGLGLR